MTVVNFDMFFGAVAGAWRIGRATIKKQKKKYHFIDRYVFYLSTRQRDTESRKRKIQRLSNISFQNRI